MGASGLKRDDSGMKGPSLAAPSASPGGVSHNHSHL